MPIRRRRLTRWLAVTVTAMTAAVAAPMAGPGTAQATLHAFATRKAILTLAAGASGGVTVDCEGSEVAISGGFSAGVANDVLIDTSRPLPNSNDWFLSAVNTLTTTQTVEVFAVCAIIEGRNISSRTASVAPGANPAVTQACTSGSNTGGGFHIDAVARFPVMHSRPTTTGQGWSVVAFNNTTVSHSVTVYTVCAEFSGRQVASRTAILEPGTSATVPATCSDTQLAIGGGWEHGGGTRWLVDRSKQEGLRVWTGHYVNATTSVRSGVTTYAVCAAQPF